MKKLSARLADIESTKLFAATSKSIYYRLSKTDAAICDLSKIDLFNEKIKDEISIMRQTKKNQYLIDTSKDPIKDINEDKLDFHVIDPTADFSFSDEQINNAIVTFDEEIQARIELFMKQFEVLKIEDD